ncbi:MAG: acyl carrier protein [Ignavibacteriales bacterium]|nr:acyl carrier protein [Ignavibacteriales bacterium]
MENDKSSIEATLAEYIREVCLPRNDGVNLKYDTNLFDAGIVDSAGLISFLCFIEKEFDVNIPDEDLVPENFVSIARIADYVCSHQQVPYERS